MLQHCSTCDRNVLVNDDGRCPSCGNATGLNDDVVDLQSGAVDSLATRVIECRRSRLYLRGVKIYAVAMLLLFGWSAYAGLMIRHRTDLSVMGLAGMTSAISIFVVLIRSQDPKVVRLKIDDAGLHSLKLGNTVIPWKDIKSLRSRTFKFNRLLDVGLRNGDDYVRRLNPVARLTHRLRKPPGSDSTLTFVLSNYDVPSDDLYRAILKRSEPYLDPA